MNPKIAVLLATFCFSDFAACSELSERVESAERGFQSRWQAMSADESKLQH